MAAYIPIDVLLTHMFKNLSVRSVVRCGCVCKEWLEILSGSEFRKIHIQHQTKNNRHHLKLLCGPLKNRYSPFNGDVQLDKYSGMFYSLDLESPSPTLTRLPGFPVSTYLRPVQNLGYSCSMLCMEVRNISQLSDPQRYIMFLNPSTSYFYVLPEPIVAGPLIIGFGYDSRAEDYKFVWVNNVTRYTHVYSLKSNSWTKTQWSSDKHKIQLDSKVESYRLVGTFVKGSIYWFVNRTKTMVRFCFRYNKLTKVSLPPWCKPGISESKSLKILQGKLCMINTVRDIVRTKINVEMWWLKEKNKWSKLLYLGSLTAEYIYPLACTNDGRVLCCANYKQECTELPPRARYALIDPRTGKIEDFDIPGINDGILSDYIFQSHCPGYIY